MTKEIEILSALAGSYEGFGLNHEKQKFQGTLRITPQIDQKGLSLDYVATAEDGTVFHKEHSLIGCSQHDSLSLWVMSSNHPGVVEHKLTKNNENQSENQTFSFSCGDMNSSLTFRETITLEIWANGDLSYNYSWGLPNGEFKTRSAVRLLAGKNRLSMKEAKYVETEHGIKPEGSGWYVLNARDAQWTRNARFGDSCGFEGNESFEQYGMNMHIMYPGQSSCHYHGEDDQENLLVVKGECKILIEGQERLLKQWDFVHFPKWSRHVCIGVGSEPCVTVMVGGRTGNGVFYPVIDLAKKYDACPSRETEAPKESYAGRPDWLKIKAPLIF